MWDVQAANPRPQFDSIVHLPGAAPGAPRVDAPCRVLSLRGNRLALLTDREIPSCIPLTVEHDDALYLGEVVGSGEVLPSDPLLQSQAASEPTGKGHADRVGYRVDVLIEQVLSGLQSLVTLRARLLDEAARSDERAGGETPSSDACAPVPSHVRNRRA
jgi:hypothetical protein